MEYDYSLLMRELLEQMYSREAIFNREEGVMFLAAIIRKKARERIRLDMESNPGLAGSAGALLGIKVRNALLMAGFPNNLDNVWFPWLRDAVSLTEKEIIVTDAVKERIRKYREALHRSKKWASEKYAISGLALMAIFMFLLYLLS